MAKILVLNGPNLNLLGQREPALYGSQTLDEIIFNLQQLAETAGVELQAAQSNYEGELVTFIQEADESDFIIINPAAYTHTSIAIRDAFLAKGIPFIEVHLSNIYSREDFRHHSYLSGIAKGVISGFGPLGYELALTAAMNYLRK